eukprot:363694-Chlamydomonas_euryale.AAC.1
MHDARALCTRALAVSHLALQDVWHLAPQDVWHPAPQDVWHLAPRDVPHLALQHVPHLAPQDEVGVLDAVRGAPAGWGAAAAQVVAVSAAAADAGA